MGFHSTGAISSLTNIFKRQYHVLYYKGTLFKEQVTPKYSQTYA